MVALKLTDEHKKFLERFQALLAKYKPVSSHLTMMRNAHRGGIYIVAADPRADIRKYLELDDNRYRREAFLNQYGDIDTAIDVIMAATRINTATPDIRKILRGSVKPSDEVIGAMAVKCGFLPAETQELLALYPYKGGVETEWAEVVKPEKKTYKKKSVTAIPNELPAEEWQQSPAEFLTYLVGRCRYNLNNMTFERVDKLKDLSKTKPVSREKLAAAMNADIQSITPLFSKVSWYVDMDGNKRSKLERIMQVIKATPQEKEHMEKICQRARPFPPEHFIGNVIG